jgi:hypothetical protein
MGFTRVGSTSELADDPLLRDDEFLMMSARSRFFSFYFYFAKPAEGTSAQ